MAQRYPSEKTAMPVAKEKLQVEPPLVVAMTKKDFEEASTILAELLAEYVREEVHDHEH